MTKLSPNQAAEQFTVFAETLRSTLVPAVQRMAEQITAMHTALKPLIDEYERHPERFAHLGPRMESCHCLCGRHPAQPGVCTGAVEPGLTVAFNSPTVGLTHVRVCRNCHDAHMGLPVRPGQPDMGELEAVTDTCTCHCWQNHPETRGVCEAASDTGMLIAGKPACFQCWSATPRA